MNAVYPSGEPTRPDPPPPARLIALGSAALTEGFALIGFETYPDPTPEAVEDLLRDLLRRQQAALVVIEQGLVQSPGPQLTRALSGGARIVITEIPALQHPPSYRSRVDRLVESVLGASALEPQS
jgi:vacuolar-type H+-ATPase subunit F/Vma7